MGLLDDLKNQAESEKVSEEENASRQAEGEQFYQEELRPRMLKVFQFFNQLIAHLNALKMETIVEYPLLPGGNLQKLRQEGYKVLIDSSKAPKKIDFTMECVLETPIEFEIEGGGAVQSHADFLQRFAIRHERNDKKGPGQQTVSAKFILHGPIPVRATIEADVEAAGLRLTIRNFTQPGYIKYPLKIEQFTDAFLDKLGGFIIRKDANLFGSQKISEEARQKLREKILAEQQMRDQEMVEVEKRREAEEAAEKDNSSKEQLKQTVNSKVSQGKESLKGMFNRLKKQAGFGSVSTETTLPSASVAAKPQTPAQKAPIRQAPVAPKPQASTQPAPVAPKPRASTQPAPVAPKQPIPKPPASVTPASTKPTATQAHASPAMAKSNKRTAAPPPAPPSASTPKVSEPPPVPAAARKSTPPKIYEAPGDNPFLIPEQSEVSSDPETPLDLEKSNPEKLNSEKLNLELKLNPEPKQTKNDSEDKPGPESAAATVSSPNPSLTSDDLERELANFMPRDTPETPELKIPEKESEPAPPAESSSPDPLLTTGALDIDLSAPSPQANTDSEEESSPTPTAAAAPESSLTLEPVESDTDESLTSSEEESSPTPTAAEAPESSLTLEPAEPDTDVSLKSMFPKVDKTPEEKS